MSSKEVQLAALSSIEKSKFDYAPSWITDTQKYFSEARNALKKSLTIPFKSTVIISSSKALRFGIKEGPVEAWIVATSPGKWIFFDCNRADFGKAQGSIKDGFFSIGHRSHDILEVWLI